MRTRRFSFFIFQSAVRGSSGQPRNALTPISADGAYVTERNEIHPAQAASPMDAQEAGNASEVSDVHPLKARAPTAVSVSGRNTA